MMDALTEPFVVAWLAGLLALLAETLHLKRSKKLGRLAFGPASRPRNWTYAAPVLRAVCLGGLAWSMLTLWNIEPRSDTPAEIPGSQLRRIILALDVSPSMQLRDAGPDGGLSRRERASEVLESLLSRIAADQARYSVIAAYNGSQRVVEGVQDLEVIRNILNDLPMDYAFKAGKTRLDVAINDAAALAHDWPKGSATLIVVSDGDAIPGQGLESLPPSIAQTLVAGVGDSRAGLFIDGHQSRQNAAALRSLARRLRGEYYDVNEKHLPSAALQSLAKSIPFVDEAAMGRREIAITLLLGCGALLALLPVLLELFGSAWRPVVTGKGDGLTVKERHHA
ncbi:VWA domain-containing protein [Candidatus Sumerlaeota bacterium]|nr:VWA domain-containing protein [Candidatus Sumerlaeota bacterium]